MSNEKRGQTRVAAGMAAKSAVVDPKMEAAEALFLEKKSTILATKEALKTLYFANLPNNEQIKRTGAVIASYGEEGQKKRDELKAIVDRRAAREGVKEYVDQLLKLVGDQEKAYLMESITGEDKLGAKSFKTILKEKEAEIHEQVGLLDQQMVAVNNALNEKPADAIKVGRYLLKIDEVWKKLVKMEEALQEELQDRIERKEIPLQPIEENGLRELINGMHRELSRLEREIERVTNDPFMKELRDKLDSFNKVIQLGLSGGKIDLDAAKKDIDRINLMLSALDEDQEKQLKEEIDQLNTNIERVRKLDEITLSELDALLDQTESITKEIVAESSQTKLDELLQKEFEGSAADASQTGETPSIEEVLGEEKLTAAEVADLNTPITEAETKRQQNPSRPVVEGTVQEATSASMTIPPQAAEITKVAPAAATVSPVDDSKGKEDESPAEAAARQTKEAANEIGYLRGRITEISNQIGELPAGQVEDAMSEVKEMRTRLKSLERDFPPEKEIAPAAAQILGLEEVTESKQADSTVQDQKLQSTSPPSARTEQDATKTADNPEVSAEAGAALSPGRLGDLGKPGSVMYHLRVGYRIASKDIPHDEYMKLLEEHEPKLHRLAVERAETGLLGGKVTWGEWWNTVKSFAKERDFSSIIMTVGSGAALVGRDIRGLGKLITSPRAAMQERREAALKQDIQNVAFELQNRAVQQERRPNYIPGTAAVGVELTKPLFESIQADLNSVGKSGSDYNALRQKYTGTPATILKTLLSTVREGKLEAAQAALDKYERDANLNPTAAQEMKVADTSVPLETGPPPLPPERAEQIAFKTKAAAAAAAAGSEEMKVADTTVSKKPWSLETRTGEHSTANVNPSQGSMSQGGGPKEAVFEAMMRIAKTLHDFDENVMQVRTLVLPGGKDIGSMKYKGDLRFDLDILMRSPENKNLSSDLMVKVRRLTEVTDRLAINSNKPPNKATQREERDLIQEIRQEIAKAKLPNGLVPALESAIKETIQKANQLADLPPAPPYQATSVTPEVFSAAAAAVSQIPAQASETLKANVSDTTASAKLAAAPVAAFPAPPAPPAPQSQSNFNGEHEIPADLPPPPGVEQEQKNTDETAVADLGDVSAQLAELDHVQEKLQDGGAEQNTDESKVENQTSGVSPVEADNTARAMPEVPGDENEKSDFDFSGLDKVLAEQKMANAGEAAPTPEELDRILPPEAPPVKLDSMLPPKAPPVKADEARSTKPVADANKQDIHVEMTVNSAQKESLEKLIESLPHKISDWPMNRQNASHAIVKFDCGKQEMANMASELAKLDPPPKMSNACNPEFKKMFEAARQVQAVKAEQADVKEEPPSPK